MSRSPWLYRSLASAPLSAPALLGSADLPWPDEVRREMDALDRDVMALLGDVTADTSPALQEVRDSYFAWIAAWRRWYAENRESWLLYASAAAVRKELEPWIKNQRTWRDEFTRRGLKNRVPIPPPPDVPPPSVPPGQQIVEATSNLKYVALAALGIAAIVAVKR